MGLPETMPLRRVTLRRATEPDLPDYCRRIYGDAAVMRTLPGGRPVPLADALVRARGHLVEHWGAHGFGPWLVQRNADRRVLGHCGLRYWPDSEDVEVLYALEPPAWGQGLATEAAAAAVEAGFERLALARVIAGVLPGNAASRALLERLGLRDWKRLDWNGMTLDMLKVERVDWQAG